MKKSSERGYDVFISYRRGGGAETARLLKSELEKRKYRVFLDVSDLQSGHYDDALLGNIEKSCCFVVVLSPGALDRCLHEGDWLRMEITHALNHRLKIIPVMMPGFTFPEPDSMPLELRELPRHQAVDYNHNLFEAMMGKLCGYIGKPVTRNWWQRLGRAEKAAVCAACVVILAVIGFGSLALSGDSVMDSSEVEISMQDLNLLKSIANDMMGQLTQVNNVLGDVADVGRRASKALDNPAADASTLSNLAAECRHMKAQLDKTVMPAMWKGDHVDDLNRLGIPVEDLHAYYNMLIPNFWNDLKDYYEGTARRLEIPMKGRLGTEGRQTELDADCMQQDALFMQYGVLGLLSYFPDSAVVDFQKFSGQWTQLADKGIISQEESDALMQKVTYRIQDILTETASLVGNGDVVIINAQDELEAKIAEKDAADAERGKAVEQKQAEVDAKKAKLTEMQQEVETAKARNAVAKASLRETCRISDSDSLYRMWNKIVGLHDVGMTEACDEETARMIALQSGKEPDVDLCVKAVRAYWADSSAYDGAGVMVMFFENNVTHSILKRGDILLSMNGSSLRNEDDFIKAPRKTDGSPADLVFLRLNPDGVLEKHEEQSPRDNPRVAVVNLKLQ